MNIYFIGHVGSDAGVVYIGPDGKIHRQPGWNPEAMLELARAVSVIRDAVQLKTPGLTEATVKGVMEFAQKELATHLKGGGVLVIG
jgi:hypothetical protein